MSKLAGISARECIRALEKIGFYISRQEGSHVILRRDDPYAKTVVPNHKELKVGTVRGIIRDVNLTVEEFLELL